MTNSLKVIPSATFAVYPVGIGFRSSLVLFDFSANLFHNPLVTIGVPASSCPILYDNHGGGIASRRCVDLNPWGTASRQEYEENSGFHSASLSALLVFAKGTNGISTHLSPSYS
jgi:hypothetical protein